MPIPFQIAEEVRHALDKRAPVVALESTVIAHGLPRPQNLETANRLTKIVRENDAQPATIALLAGKICVGLDSEQLRHLAESSAVQKASMRDLPLIVAGQRDGATTVASTAWIAHRAGIHVFATGGIGGVHRGSLPDISSDLPELAATPIVVVCSGAKSVLDLPATREWLETAGIPVLGFQCDELPAFYARESGLDVDGRVETAAQVAEIFAAQRGLGMKQSLLVTVPVPHEFEIPRASIDRILEKALRELERDAITGNQITPFLLSRLASESDGATLRANLALLENNARVAALIARAVAEHPATTVAPQIPA